ncbi:protein zwilch-like protein [Sesbania bispinosa]|nr:protein zwilch-like protein [Sesbania bispinosa]
MDNDNIKENLKIIQEDINHISIADVPILNTSTNKDKSILVCEKKPPDPNNEYNDATSDMDETSDEDLDDEIVMDSDPINQHQR